MLRFGNDLLNPNYIESMRVDGNTLTVRMYSGEKFEYKGVLGRKYINRINALYPDMQNDQPPGGENIIHIAESVPRR